MKNNINNLKKESNNNQLDCVALSEIEEKEIEWLWQNRIPKNSLTLIEGDGGRGKSTILADICSRLSRGEKLPDDETSRPPMKILLLSEEDDPYTVLKPRYKKHTANASNVLYCQGSITLDQKGLIQIKNTITALKVDVVVIDPIVSYLGKKIDMNKGNDVRSVLAPLVSMARDHSCTFIVVRHFNKTRDSLASHKGAGSVDFRNAARSTLQVAYDRDLETSYLALEKSNYASKALSLPFTIEDEIIQWGEPTDISADAILCSSDELSSKTALEEAKEFILCELKDGPVRSKLILSNAREAGVAEKTLRRAKRIMGVVVQKTASVWQWDFKVRK